MITVNSGFDLLEVRITALAAFLKERAKLNAGKTGLAGEALS